MYENKQKSVVVAYASTGSGHKVAAEALYSEFCKKNTNAKTTLIDILSFFPQNNSGSKFVNTTTGFLSPVFDLSWRRNFTGRILWGGGVFWPSFLYFKFENYLKSINPDVVVCTHFVCANSAVKARIKYKLNFQVISVPTDFETEGLWPHKETDLFCVATEDMAHTLLSRRVSKDRIIVSGIPIASEFTNTHSAAEGKQVFNLPNNKIIALVICGAKDSGPYKNMRKTLDLCLPYFAKMNWVHFVFCVGDDSVYSKKIAKYSSRTNTSNFTVLTYTDKMPQLMAASDVAIIKPGGLVVSECISQNLPMLLTGKAYAQENINRRYLVSRYAAEHVVTHKGIIKFLCGISTNKYWYSKLKAGVKNIKKSNSAELICNKILSQLDNTHSQKSKLSNNIYIGNVPVHSR